MKIWLKRIFALFVSKQEKKGYSVNRITFQINSPEDAARAFKKIWNKNLIEEKEQVYVLYLNEYDTVVSHEELHTGGICQTVIDSTLLLRNAIRAKAHSIVIAHNHPNNSLKPSSADKVMTKDIENKCKVVNIKLRDHIIMTPAKGYYSFSESGLLE